MSGLEAKHPQASLDADDPWGFGKTSDALVEVHGVPAMDTVTPAPPVRSRRRGVWMAVPATLVVVGLVAFAVGRQSAVATEQPSGAMGTLVVSSHPSGAQVAVDGQAAGTTPLALRVAPGRHAVVVTGAAGLSEQFSAEIAADSSESRHVSLVPPAPEAAALTVTATPAGGEVFVDGARVGTAPLSVSDLTPGDHVVQLRSQTGTVERRVSLAAATMTSLVFDAPAAAGAAGWITFSLPFDVQVFEGASHVGTNRGDRIMVAAGRHTFDLVNETLGFRSSHSVVVGAGQTARIAVAPPVAAVSVNAQPWAEVVIGGRSYGETPLANIPLPLGVHEVTLRHPSLGERVQPVTVRLGAPNRVSVDLRR